jgi:hypothetical protein
MDKEHRNDRSSAMSAISCVGALCVLSFGTNPAGQEAQQDAGAPGQPGAPAASAPATLEETRLVMGKWIETQQIISKERNDWQQGKEILVSRVDLVKREIAGLEEKIQQAQASAAETNAKRDEQLAKTEELKASAAQLTEAAAAMEARIRELFGALPDPIQAKLQPLRQRIPEDPANTRVSVAERFQNVLGILNELNKANTDITVTYEVRNLSDGKPSEVQVIYVGLAQAYYVSPGGEAGIGRPGAQGWQWESSNAIANDVLKALEIFQAKHTPAFVPLPVKLQ